MRDASLKIWKDKLEFLQVELATAVDPEAKFKLRKAIEEAEAEIFKLSGARTSQPSRKLAGTQLDKHAPKVLFGRETELAELDAAWAKETLNVYTLVAWGGAGKTSLVFHWVQTRFAAKEPKWLGVERYFDWSFYSQGTGESRQTSADLFINKALEFFGDLDPTKGGPHERGERLAGLIRKYRTLLVLDGIEPLQYPPNDPQAGRLKDPALETLLRELAADNPGLVVITTREHLTNLHAYATTDEQKLDKLAKEAAVALLRHLQIVGTDGELHAAWQDAGGHALTLSLLGRYIADAYEDRDIRHYHEVNFEAADVEHQGRSAFKVMIAYERWLQSGGPELQRELAVLRLTGLFDRPIAKGCLEALRAEPSIPGLTETLVKLTPQQWNIAVKRLSEVELLSVSPDSIDAHPLIREYFAVQLKREQQEAFREAHSRLFDYLCKNTSYRPDGLDGLAPLYQAITHGCLAGRHTAALNMVYHDRVLRGTEDDGFYSSQTLGAFGQDLAALAAFFEVPWDRVSTNLSEDDRLWLISQVAFRLRSIGRIGEAIKSRKSGLDFDVRAEKWDHAALSADNLSEVLLINGQISESIRVAERAVDFAKRTNDQHQILCRKTTLANALHQSGQRAEAGRLFQEAERMQKELDPNYSLLYSSGGFHYSDWLLALVERRAWLNLTSHSSVIRMQDNSSVNENIKVVCQRSNRTLGWMIKNQMPQLQISRDRLTLAKVNLLATIVEGPFTGDAYTCEYLPQAIRECRNGGRVDELPRFLLTAALYHFVRGEYALAEKHLAEAQQIAERGPMPLVLADIHLTRARMAGIVKFKVGSVKDDARSANEASKIWDIDPQAELAKAAYLIRNFGYGRRYDELADAEKVILSLSNSKDGSNSSTNQGKGMPPALDSSGE